MTKTIKKEARTVNEAVRLALDDLGVPADRAMVEVIDEGKSGILGFGSRPAIVEVSYEETLQERVLAFLAPIMVSMGISPEVTFTEEEGRLFVKLNCEDSGIAIGRRGETLDALQYLTGLAVNKDNEAYVRLHMDVSDYRLRREETLVKLAHRVAEKVQKTRRNVTLEPMNPYERRIIHATLQGLKDIETGSVGEEPTRRVVVRSTRPLHAEGGRLPTDRPEHSDRQMFQGQKPAQAFQGRQQPTQGKQVNGYGSPSPQENPNSYRNRSTERIGYVGNPTASGSSQAGSPKQYGSPSVEQKDRQLKAYKSNDNLRSGVKPYDIEDDIGPQG